MTPKTLNGHFVSILFVICLAAQLGGALKVTFWNKANFQGKKYEFEYTPTTGCKHVFGQYQSQARSARVTLSANDKKGTEKCVVLMDGQYCQGGTLKVIGENSDIEFQGDYVKDDGTHFIFGCDSK